MTRSELASRIEHTNLAPDARVTDIELLCAQAGEHHFAAVCVHPTRAALASARLQGTQIEICAVVGFPSGAHDLRIKVQEARHAVDCGANAIDMVANSGLLLDGEASAYAFEILSVRQAIGDSTTMKVIIEAPLLGMDGIKEASRLATESGVNYVKTSTGIYAQARREDVRLLRRILPSHVRIKAAGGIRTAAFAIDLLEAGADRLGTSKSMEIIEGLPQS